LTRLLAGAAAAAAAPADRFAAPPCLCCANQKLSRNPRLSETTAGLIFSLRYSPRRRSFGRAAFSICPPARAHALSIPHLALVR
jgi:hypothetical protein